MKYLLFNLLISLTYFAYAQSYIGEIQVNNQYEYLKIVCKNDSCSFSLPYLYLNKKEFLGNDFQTSGKGSFYFGLDKIDLKSTISKTGIDGQITISKSTQPFKLLLQKEALEHNIQKQFVGVYKSKSGSRAIVYERFGYLHLMSPITNETVSLKPIETNTFWSVTAETSRFENLKNENFQKLSITTRNGTEIEFNRIDRPLESELYLPIGKDTLYAKLYLPQSKDKVPACLILPGGGAIGIDNYLYEARFLASYGIATLVFDKPGNGKSKGESNFRIQDFEEKNKQYQQVFNFLRNHPAIDSNKVGIHGPSEGGRLSLLMAIDLKEKVAFVNSVAAPLMTLREGQFYAMDQHHRLMGVNEIDNMKIQQIWNDYYDGIVKGSIDSAIVDRALEYLNANPNLFLPNNYTYPASPKSVDIDNDRVLKEIDQITCPILFQYGENDTRVNAYKSLQNLYRFKTSGIETIFYRRGSHSFMTPEYKICPNYMDDKIKWLQKIKMISL